MPEALCEELGIGRAAAIEGLRGIAVALETVSALALMCDPRDLGQTLGDDGEENGAPAGGGRVPQPGFDPTLFLFDNVPGGVGLAERIHERAAELFTSARQLVRGCVCPDGAPGVRGGDGDGGRAPQAGGAGALREDPGGGLSGLVKQGVGSRQSHFHARGIRTAARSSRPCGAWKTSGSSLQLPRRPRAVRHSNPRHVSDKLDALPYGVIKLDRRGVVTAFNAHEERASRRTRDQVVGKRFFHDVAPCARVHAFYGRFLEAVETRRLDMTFGFVFPFPHGDRHVLVTLFYQTADDFIWVIVRDTRAPAAR